MGPSETVKILPSAKINPLEIGPNFHLRKLISLSYAISIYDAIATLKVYYHHGK